MFKHYTRHSGNSNFSLFDKMFESKVCRANANNALIYIYKQSHTNCLHYYNNEDNNTIYSSSYYTYYKHIEAKASHPNSHKIYSR